MAGSAHWGLSVTTETPVLRAIEMLELLHM